VRAQTPVEACIRIAAEHAACTLAAIEEERASRLAARLGVHGRALVELATAGGEPGTASSEEER
jgi:hypothetical protein